MAPQLTERTLYQVGDSAEQLRPIHDALVATFPDHVILYRGQTILYPTLQSGRRRPGVKVNADVEQGWSVVAGKIIAEGGEAQNALHLRKAVLQHYGFVTDYLDLTSDIHIAAWFATNESDSRTTFWGGGPPRRFSQTRYTRRVEGTGYVVVVAVPRAEIEKESPTVFDISRLQHLVRPQRQRAWLMLARPPLLPDPNAYWIATVELDCRRRYTILN